MRRSISFGILVAALILGGLATPAAQSNAQIQQALQIFLQQAHTWTQTQTFNNIVVTGSCTGCGGGGTPGGADTSIQFNDSGVFGGSGQFTYNASAVTLQTLTDADTSDTVLTLGVHANEGDAAALEVAVAGGEGDTPTTTLTFPGDAVFSASVAGDENLIVFENPTTGGTSQFRVLGGIDGVNEVSLSFRATADTGVALTQTSTNGPYPFLFVGASAYTFDASNGSFRLPNNLGAGYFPVVSVAKGNNATSIGYVNSEWTMMGENTDGGGEVSVTGFGFEANIDDTGVVTNSNFYIYDWPTSTYLMSMTPTGTLFNTPLTIASAQLPATTTTFTNGAAAAVGTLTNAPAAGNPTKWIPIDDNGTTRYIPAW